MNSKNDRETFSRNFVASDLSQVKFFDFYNFRDTDFLKEILKVKGIF